MAIAMGTSRSTCHHGATGSDCGICTGERSRADAKAAGVPATYWTLTRELGWVWAAGRGSRTLHLVPPEGDQAQCGRPLPRAERSASRRGVAEHGCRKCKAAVGIGARP